MIVPKIIPLWKPRRALRSFAELAPNTVLMQVPRFAEVTSEASPMLRRSHLRSFPELAPISFADASPKSLPKLRRSID